MPKIRLVKDYVTPKMSEKVKGFFKAGLVFDTSEKDAECKVRQGFAEYVPEDKESVANTPAVIKKQKQRPIYSSSEIRDRQRLASARERQNMSRQVIAIITDESQETALAVLKFCQNYVIYRKDLFKSNKTKGVLHG